MKVNSMKLKADSQAWLSVHNERHEHAATIHVVDPELVKHIRSRPPSQVILG